MKEKENSSKEEKQSAMSSRGTRTVC